MKDIWSRIAVVALTFLLAMPAFESLHAQGWQQTPKGPRPATTFSRVHTQAELDKMKSGTIAMVCGMCKSLSTVTITSDVYSKGRVQWMRPGTVMDCPGCGGKITVKAGSKETEVKHVCSKCGGESAFCCATKKGQKTEGM